MRLSLLFVAFAMLAASGRANIYVPNAKLAGETVQVRIGRDAASVTAVFQFESLDTRDAKVIYFPIFAGAATDPIQLLAASRLEFELGGKKVGLATPCEVPARFADISKRSRIFWYAVRIDDFLADDDFNVERPVVIKASYSQPLINDRFFYLPVIVGQKESRSQRQWPYQMHVHSGTRVVTMMAKDVDHEQLADGVVVFLKDGQIVEVR